MLTKRTYKIIIGVLLSNLILIILSGFSLFYMQPFFIEKLYWESLISTFFITALFIIITTLLFILFYHVYLKNKTKNLFFWGLSCVLINTILLLFSMGPFFEINRFLMSSLCISTYCFFIPYTYVKFGGIFNEK
ncbi:magnesium-transporting ATPase (P-type) [Mucilaginibacter sp. UYCu711]